jgi:hypothetical protein
MANYIAKPDGTIWRELKDGSLKQIKGSIKKGYRYFDRCMGVSEGEKTFKRKFESFHRFIAEQLIPNPDNLPVVDHINRNRLDNRVENLRWASREDNWYNFELSIEKSIQTLERAGYTIIKPKGEI